MFSYISWGFIIQCLVKNMVREMLMHGKGSYAYFQLDITMLLIYLWGQVLFCHRQLTCFLSLIRQ